jgi:hypothetical protein
MRRRSFGQLSGNFRPHRQPRAGVGGNRSPRRVSAGESGYAAVNAGGLKRPAPRCGPEGRGFKSPRSPQLKSQLTADPARIGRLRGVGRNSSPAVVGGKTWAGVGVPSRTGFLNGIGGQLDQNLAGEGASTRRAVASQGLAALRFLYVREEGLDSAYSLDGLISTSSVPPSASGTCPGRIARAAWAGRRRNRRACVIRLAQASVTIGRVRPRRAKCGGHPQQCDW